VIDPGDECEVLPLHVFGATRLMSRLLLTAFTKVRRELVTSEPPKRTRTLVRHCCFRTSAIGSRASRYEESCVRGAFFCSAYSQYRPVHRKRREVRLPAFLPFRLSRNDLRRIESPDATLRFERDQPGSERNPQGLFRTPESCLKTL